MSQNGPPIIIKKRAEQEEDHHGGVWKLAFADFMTAMMAFFLVMWLINSTSKETKAVIVQYFNPVQLVDSTKAHKGLRDPESGAEGKSAVDQPASQKQSDSEKKMTEALQSEPLKTLDAIAREEPPRPPQPPASSALRDPFDRSPKRDTPPVMESAPADEPIPQDKANLKHGQTTTGDKAKTATDLQAEIEDIAAREAQAPKVETRQTEEGLLISLTDSANFSMFDVGSIKPRPQLVRIIGEIGKTLAGRRGEVEIRGHTDGRSYSGKNYDNWRLASDRAIMANYMLIRGGLPAARIGRIVGFADRRLKNAKDPLSPLNRRIEILLHGAAP